MTRTFVSMLIIILLTTCGCLGSDENEPKDEEARKTRYSFSFSTSTNLTEYELIIPIPINLSDGNYYDEWFISLSDMEDNSSFSIVGTQQAQYPYGLHIRANGSIQLISEGELGWYKIYSELSMKEEPNPDHHIHWFFSHNEFNQSINVNYSFSESATGAHVWIGSKEKDNHFFSSTQIVIEPGWHVVELKMVANVV